MTRIFELSKPLNIIHFAIIYFSITQIYDSITIFNIVEYLVIFSRKIWGDGLCKEDKTH